MYKLRKYAHYIYLILFIFAVAVGGIIVLTRSKDTVVINEVCSSNVSCCEDENGNYPDWIELYNPTERDVDLSGYIVNKSTDLKKEKYVIPDGVILSPGSFYLFDPGFSISSEGATLNLLDKKRHYIDRISIPDLKYDTTYARQNDGDNTWKIKQPTPGYQNAEGEEIEPVAEGLVGASRDSGFYEEEFDLSLDAPGWGRKIYYTTDATDPKVNGIAYDGPIHICDRSGDENHYAMTPEMSLDYVEGRVSLPSYDIDKCTVIRAVAKDALGRYTDISTYTYFVGYGAKSAYDNMTVVSVTSDPNGLFSYEDGILVLGRDYDEYVAAGQPDPDEYGKADANYARRGRMSERYADVEIFDTTHENALSTPAGLRVRGLSSRMDVQKSFSIIFRSAYGGKYRETFSTDGMDFDIHSVAIDKCGTDPTKMMDVIMADCMKDTECATKDGVPCCLFLNGEYWGFYWLTERFDAGLMADKYGVTRDLVEFRDGERFESGDEWNEDNFDRESLIDYYAGNVLAGHDGDWPFYNLRFWRTTGNDETPYGDTKMRPVIFDMNSRSFTDPAGNTFERLLEFYPFYALSSYDETFREDLVKRIDEMSTDKFEQSRMLTLIDSLYGRIHDQMVLDRMRFSNCSKEEAEREFSDDVDVLRNFIRERNTYLETYKEEYLNGQ